MQDDSQPQSNAGISLFGSQQQNLLQNQSSSNQSGDTSSVLNGNATQATLTVSGGGTGDSITPDYLTMAMTGLLILGIIALIFIFSSQFLTKKKKH